MFKYKMLISLFVILSLFITNNFVYAFSFRSLVDDVRDGFRDVRDTVTGVVDDVGGFFTGPASAVRQLLQLTESGLLSFDDFSSLVQRPLYGVPFTGPMTAVENLVQLVNSGSISMEELSRLIPVLIGLPLASIPGAGAAIPGADAAIPGVDGLATGSLSIPFGGPIILSVPCICSNGQYLLITDYSTGTPSPKPLPVMFEFGVSRVSTPQNLASLFTPGAYTLGTYATLAEGVSPPCLTGALCAPLPVAGIITPIPLPGVGFSPPLGL
ncbi:MAG TPA: hypothetical protein PJ997_01545 [Candidatus Paceibacterota bacterium]|nr:hypothetical protein [Candidatus Paceibacterota bacterium]HMP19003.1 hypothetical protein [Candidatus Paceibacterota bacterium]HMP85382.1 hypothetical protein [Candidatus Paceibacterota bacterium]